MASDRDPLVVGDAPIAAWLKLSRRGKALANTPADETQPSMHVVEAVSPHPGFLAEAVECDNPSSLNPAGNAAASWLFVFFLVNHFENLNSMET